MHTGNPKRNIIETLETIQGAKWVRTDKIPHRDDQENIVGIIGFAVDITQRKHAQEALQRAHDELAERVRERTPGQKNIATPANGGGSI